MNKLGINNKYKEEEIQRVRKISRFFINNLKQLLLYLALESD